MRYDHVCTAWCRKYRRLLPKAFVCLALVLLGLSFLRTRDGAIKAEGGDVGERLRDLVAPLDGCGENPLYTAVTWSENQLKLLNETLFLDPPKVLDGFKNPCWREGSPATSPYAGNHWRNTKHAGKFVIDRLHEKWTNRSKNTHTTIFRCAPYYYIIGFTKSGTSDLYKRLQQHRSVVRVAYKEPMWWTRKRMGLSLYQEFVPVGDYISLYDEAAEEIYTRSRHGFTSMMIGDGTPSTVWENRRWFLYPENNGLIEPRVLVAHQLRHFTPMAKIIIAVRNPTDRLYSDYLFHAFTKKPVPENKVSPADFHKRVLESVAMAQQCVSLRGIRACVYDPCLGDRLPLYLMISIYYPFIKDWLEVFPRDQVHICRLEDYAADRTIVIDGVLTFLGLEPMPRNVSLQISKMNAGNAQFKKYRRYGMMLNKTRQLLDNFYRPYNKMLATLLKDDRFMWAKK